MTKTTNDIIIDEHGRVLNDPTHAEPLSHGNTVAGWSLVILVLLGCAVVAVGMLMAANTITYTGLGLIVAGLVVGFVLKVAGYGMGGAKTKSGQ